MQGIKLFNLDIVHLGTRIITEDKSKRDFRSFDQISAELLKMGQKELYAWQGFKTSRKELKGTLLFISVRLVSTWSNVQVKPWFCTIQPPTQALRVWQVDLAQAVARPDAVRCQSRQVQCALCPAGWMIAQQQPHGCVAYNAGSVPGIQQKQRPKDHAHGPKPCHTTNAAGHGLASAAACLSLKALPLASALGRQTSHGTSAWHSGPASLGPATRAHDIHQAKPYRARMPCARTERVEMSHQECWSQQPRPSHFVSTARQAWALVVFCRLVPSPASASTSYVGCPRAPICLCPASIAQRLEENDIEPLLGLQQPQAVGHHSLWDPSLQSRSKLRSSRPSGPSQRWESSWGTPPTCFWRAQGAQGRAKALISQPHGHLPKCPRCPTQTPSVLHPQTAAPWHHLVSGSSLAPHHPS